MPDFDPNIRAYYERAGEVNRLSGGFPAVPFEFECTKEIIIRYLATPPLKVLDIGGGAGVYAAWLAARSEQVRHLMLVRTLRHIVFWTGCWTLGNEP